MKRTIKILVAVVLLWGTVRAQTGQSDVPYDIVVERDVMVPMRDNVKLNTDIYRPARNGVAVTERLPILLFRTPYEMKQGYVVNEANFFAQHGYVVILQNTRGRYKSEGTFRKYNVNDARDAYDSIQWLAKLPYTDGHVGMWGGSYNAHTQADAAKMNPSALRTLVLNFGGLSNAWDNAVRHGGGFELGRELTWAWDQIAAESKDPLVKKYIAQEKVTDWYAALPLRKGLSPLSIAPEYEAYFNDEMTHSDYDEMWKGIGLNWSEYYAQTADISMLHIGGWYDIWLRTTTDNYVNLSKLKKGPIRMLIGPWVHGGNARSFAGEVEFGPEGALTDFSGNFHLRWFDHYLKGRQTGAEKDAPVRLFIMGTGDGHKTPDGKLFHGGFWRDAQGWPLPEARVTPYFFHADGSLKTTPPGAGAPPTTTYTYDPHNPVPTIGGNIPGRNAPAGSISPLKGGAYDQRERADFYASKPPYLPLRARRDIVVFQTEPLTEDVTVIGPVSVKLFASSTAVDTDFTAKLVDVYPPSTDFPNGYDMNITDGLLRARYRGGRTHEELMKPGEVCELEIRPFPTANVFKKGHRIRIDISSSNFPRFDINPNTGEPLGRNRRMIAADNTVYHSSKYPSQVLLSLVPVVASRR